VARSVSAVCDLGADLVTIHAAVGGRALAEAAQAAAAYGDKRTRLLAVTVLTSQAGTPEEVLRLATLARQNGADGVICSPHEAARIRAELGPELMIVTPGIRWATTDDDQARTAGPRSALNAGADLLVIGRPIYAAADPVAALQELEAALE
jgi:orotidine-5'-phosphate decarboxylase